MIPLEWTFLNKRDWKSRSSVWVIVSSTKSISVFLQLSLPPSNSSFSKKINCGQRSILTARSKVKTILLLNNSSWQGTHSVFELLNVKFETLNWDISHPINQKKILTFSHYREEKARENKSNKKRLKMYPASSCKRKGWLRLQKVDSEQQVWEDSSIIWVY